MIRRAARLPALAALLPALLLATPGCGTLLTRKHGQDTDAFSGCRADLFLISAPFVLAAGDPSCLTGIPFCLTAGLVDLPFSFVADLVVLAGRLGGEDEPEAPARGAPVEAAPTSAADPGEVALARAEPPSLTLEATPSGERIAPAR